MVDNGWLHDAELVRLIIIIIMADCWLMLIWLLGIRKR
jgi:hypothetical protein